MWGDRLFKGRSFAFSIEAENKLTLRHSPLSSNDVVDILGDSKKCPISLHGRLVACDDNVTGSRTVAGYRGVLKNDILTGQRRLLGKPIVYFSSSHERSAPSLRFRMSNLAKGTPCYGLTWEGGIGAFYEIDSELNITLLAMFHE